MGRVLALGLAVGLLAACAGSEGTATAPAPASQVVERSEPPPTSTPEPGPTAVTFDPIKLAGKGKKIAKFMIPEGAAAIADITHEGQDNFIVDTIDAGGAPVDYLVNEIGNYAGTVLFDAGADEARAGD